MSRQPMTSRERVVRTLARQEADRVPIDYSCNPGIDARLKAHYGLKPDDREGLNVALGVDFRGLYAPYRGPRLHAEVPDRHVDPQWGIRTCYIDHGSGGYWDYCDFPLRDADEEVAANWPMPSPDDYDYSVIAETCRRHPDRALHVGDAGLGDTMNSSGMIRSPGQVLLDVLTEDPAWQTFIDRKLAIQLEVARRVIEAAKGRVDFLWIGEDLGSQQGPLIGVNVFRRMIRPRLQKFVDLARAHDLPVMIHCCGSSSWAFDDFVEMGITAVDTLQPEARDMSPAYLKGRWGDRLAFHGCISTAGPLSFGTVADVEKEVRETLAVMMPGGGYCLAPTHAIQDNSPTENVVAMYDAAKKYGTY